MSLASVEALLRRNAQACEEARFPECKCHCGGAFHGVKHSDAWICATSRELHAEREEERAEVLELERARIERTRRRLGGDQLELL